MADPWKVPYVDLKRQYAGMRDEILACLDDVFSNARFILRDEVGEFERQIGDTIGVGHVVGVNSGTDALMLSLKALNLGPGDEVITVSHTFVATISAIVHCGAKPVLVDIGPDMNMNPACLEAALGPNSRAVLPVHLNGRVCDMETIRRIAEDRGLAIIEDAAQALGASLGGQMAGSFGAAGCFSLHPLKNLNVGGDGGFISTDDGDLAERLRILRNIGQRTKEEVVCFGYNSRLDTIHAAVALLKMKRLSDWIERRRVIAGGYDTALRGVGDLRLPPPPAEKGYHDVYSSYVIRSDQRAALMDHLRADGIEVFNHWPVPVHRQTALGLDEWQLPETDRVSAEVLSLPVFPEMTDDEQDLVVASVRRFFGD